MIASAVIMGALAGARAEDAAPADPSDTGTADAARALSAIRAMREALAPEGGRFEVPAYGTDKRAEMEPFVVEGFRYHGDQPLLHLTLDFADPGIMPFDLDSFLIDLGWPDLSAPTFYSTVRAPQHRPDVPWSIAVVIDEQLTRFVIQEISRGVSRLPEGLFVSERAAAAPTVLLDGVTLNDPLDGVVQWARSPRFGLQRIEMLAPGGALAWGAVAPVGLLQLFSKPATRPSRRSSSAETVGGTQTDLMTAWLGDSTGQAATWVGSADTWGAEFVSDHAMAGGTIQLAGRTAGSDGYYRLAPADRGDVDQRAWQRHHWLTLRVRRLVTDKLDALVTLRASDDRRGGGISGESAHSSERFASVQLAGRVGSAAAWNGMAYVQEHDGERSIQLASSDRTTAGPASDQHARPASVVGGFLTGAVRRSNSATTVGIDWRSLSAESQEWINWTGSEFAQERIAGGEQHGFGGFVLHETRVRPELHLIVGGRVDHWIDKEGYRQDRDRGTGALLADNAVESRSGTHFGPTVGFIWKPTGQWRISAAAQRGFSRPTLQQMLVPSWREDGTWLDSNSRLRVKESTTFESSALYSFTRSSAPDKESDTTAGVVLLGNVGATVFRTETRHAFGALRRDRTADDPAAAGVAREWSNVGTTQYQGLRLSAHLEAGSFLMLDAAVQWTDSEVRSGARPGFEGRRVPDGPRRAASVRAMVLLPASVTIDATARWESGRYSDWENRARVGESVLFDLRLIRPLTPRIDWFMLVENVTDEKTGTWRGDDNLLRIVPGRTFSTGVRGSW